MQLGLWQQKIPSVADIPHYDLNKETEPLRIHCDGQVVRCWLKATDGSHELTVQLNLPRGRCFVYGLWIMPAGLTIPPTWLQVKWRGEEALWLEPPRSERSIRVSQEAITRWDPNRFAEGGGKFRFERPITHGRLIERGDGSYVLAYIEEAGPQYNYRLWVRDPVKAPRSYPPNVIELPCSDEFEQFYAQPVG